MLLYHLALTSDWCEAEPTGSYRVSTIGRTLEQEGFIHCARDQAQVRFVREQFYADAPEPVVVLSVDTDRLTSPWRLDAVPLPGGGSTEFPHVYGPIDVDAVVAVTPLLPEAPRPDRPVVEPATTAPKPANRAKPVTRRRTA